MKVTPAQKRMLSYLLDCDPERTRWTDVSGYDGGGRNPTFRKLRDLGLIEYGQLVGNSFRATLTVRGIHYLHGENT